MVLFVRLPNHTDTEVVKTRGALWKYLNLAVDEQLFYSLPVSLMQTSVMQTDAKGKGQLEVRIPHGGNDIGHLNQRSGK